LAELVTTPVPFTVVGEAAGELVQAVRTKAVIATTTKARSLTMPMLS
jgi:hypothetical protein